MKIRIPVFQNNSLNERILRAGLATELRNGATVIAEGQEMIIANDYTQNNYGYYEFDVPEINLTTPLKLFVSSNTTTWEEVIIWGGEDGMILAVGGGSSSTPQTQFTFMGDQALWFIAEDAIEVTTPVEQKDAGTAEYQFISEDGLTSNPAIFPLEMAEGDRLRMTVTDFNNYFNIIVKYTLACILLMLMIGTGYAQNNNISSKKITTDSLRGLNGDVISLKSVLATQKNIIPNVDDIIDLGEESFRYNTMWTNEVNGISAIIAPSDLDISAVNTANITGNSVSIAATEINLNSVVTVNGRLLVDSIYSPTTMSFNTVGENLEDFYFNGFDLPTLINNYSVTHPKIIADSLRGISGSWGLLSLENGRRIQLENRSTVDSAHIKLFMPGGAYILNKYGASFVGVSGNPLANDSIMFKVGGNHNFWKYDMAITSNPTGNSKTGIFFNVMEQTDSLIIGGLTGNTPSNAKVNLLGTVYANNINVSGIIGADTLRNLTGAMLVDDTLTVTKRLNVTQDIYGGNDILVSNGRYFGLASNSNGTLGVLFNATADGVARMRNFGLSADASLQIGRLIATNQTPISTATSTGSAGTTVIGSDGYIYICIATNTWRRVQAVTW